MRIVLDLQGGQSSSRERGIGRYSLALAQAIARNAGEHEVWLALSSALPGATLDLRAAFQGLIPPERIAGFALPGAVAEQDGRNVWTARAGELLREHALAELEPDLVHVSSLFEGWHENVATSIGALHDRTPSAATLYDLIPHHFPAKFLALPGQRAWYERKLRWLRNAELLLAISEYTRQDAIETLGLAPERVVAIGAAADPRFRPTPLSPAKSQELRDRYGIRRPFVQWTGVVDSHKNVEGLIRAFALLPKELRARHQLLLVAPLGPYDRGRLLRIARSAGLSRDDLVLAGYIPDADLVALYGQCALAVLPSLYEGFGLPALEAMACGAPAIGSNVSSIPEVIGCAGALFDPARPESIAEVMRRALEDGPPRRELLEHATRQAAKFSWDACARKAIAAFEQMHAARNAKVTSAGAPPGARRGAAAERYRELVESLARLKTARHPAQKEMRALAACIAHNEAPLPPRQLLVDVTLLALEDARTGIQRVVRGVLLRLLRESPAGYRVEPVYWDNRGAYRHARRLAARLTGEPESEGEGRIIEARRGDLFLGLDLVPQLFPRALPLFEDFKREGLRVCFIVYDLIALRHPRFCGPGMPKAFEAWMRGIASVADKLMGISNATADDVRAWLEENAAEVPRQPAVGYFHLSGEIENSAPTRGFPPGAAESLARLEASPSFLMVGTIEPRKGYAQALAAFEQLWQQGQRLNLVLVGKPGWNVDEFMAGLRRHGERNKQLHWLEGISDEYMRALYGACTALIAASEAEGFGLPLLEAAEHHLPILARDIPVFREVAGEHASYFSGNEPAGLAAAVLAWLARFRAGNAPRPEGMPRLSWAESTRQLLEAILPPGGLPAGRRD